MPSACTPTSASRSGARASSSTRAPSNLPDLALPSRRPFGERARRPARLRRSVSHRRRARLQPRRRAPPHRLERDGAPRQAAVAHVRTDVVAAPLRGAQHADDRSRRGRATSPISSNARSASPRRSRATPTMRGTPSACSRTAASRRPTTRSASRPDAGPSSSSACSKRSPSSRRSCSCPLSAMLDREEHRLAAGTTIAVVTAIMPDDLAATILRLHRRGHQVVVLTTSGEGLGRACSRAFPCATSRMRCRSLAPRGVRATRGRGDDMTIRAVRLPLALLVEVLWSYAAVAVARRRPRPR